jgi:hypothetical protein
LLHAQLCVRTMLYSLTNTNVVCMHFSFSLIYAYADMYVELGGDNVECSF